MDKIYSRPRLLLNTRKFRNKMPQNFDKKDTVKKIIKTGLIVVIAVIVASSLLKALEPIINRQCINMAKSLGTQISNEQAAIVISQYDYEDFINIVQDNNGNIRMIKSNVISINEVTSNVAIKIQNKIDSIEDSKFYIRLGSFTGVKLFSGRGPKVYVKMSTAGSVETKLVSEFSSVGINQTLHRIYMEVKCNIAVLTPYSSSEQSIYNQVLLAESVIVGTTPETYYNLEGMTTEDSLNMI